MVRKEATDFQFNIYIFTHGSGRFNLRSGKKSPARKTRCLSRKQKTSRSTLLQVVWKVSQTITIHLDTRNPVAVAPLFAWGDEDKMERRHPKRAHSCLLRDWVGEDLKDMSFLSWHRSLPSTSSTCFSKTGGSFFSRKIDFPRDITPFLRFPLLSSANPKPWKKSH